MLVKELINQLQTQYKPDQHIAAHLWCTADVMNLAVEMETEVPTQQKADDIIDYVQEHIDCEMGITWDTLRYAIEKHLIND